MNDDHIRGHVPGVLSQALKNQEIADEWRGGFFLRFEVVPSSFVRVASFLRGEPFDGK